MSGSRALGTSFQLEGTKGVPSHAGEVDTLSSTPVAVWSAACLSWPQGSRAGTSEREARVHGGENGGVVAAQPCAVCLLGGSPCHDQLQLGGRPRGRPRLVPWAGLLPQALVLFCAFDPIPSFWPPTSPLGGAATPVLFPAASAMPFGGRASLALRCGSLFLRLHLGLNRGLR